MAARDDRLEMLGRVPLFEGLSKGELRAVLRSSQEVDHPAGKEVVREGTEGTGFHLILAGDATVIQGGRRKRSLGPGDYFGDIALIDRGPRTATVRADTDMHTLSIAAWHFKPLLHEHPKMAFKLLIELCRRLRAAESATPVS
jgi:CRP-like cAMP-binding protein